MPNRIAVLIPVYNNWTGLRKSLESLSLQSVASDVLVIDDGSTPAISEELCRQHHPTCRVVRQDPNAGIIAALNSGLAILRGKYEYVARIDAGDWCVPTRMEQQARFLDNNPRMMLVGSDTGFTDASGRIVYVHRAPHEWSDIQRQMHVNSCFAHPATMMRASVFDTVGIYATEDICAEDYGLFFRIASKYPVANLPEVLTFAELNPNGISLSRRKQQLRSRLHIQLRHFRMSRPISYFGVLKTIALMLTPVKVTLRLKQQLFRRSSNSCPTPSRLALPHTDTTKDLSNTCQGL